MTPLEAARRWARQWETAWRKHDVAAVAALYADGASFHSHPFRDPQAPAEYAAWAFESEQPGARVVFAEPLLLADGRAIVEWKAVARERPGGATISLAGVSLLRFDEAGFVVAQRDYWGEHPGDREPFAA